MNDLEKVVEALRNVHPEWKSGECEVVAGRIVNWITEAISSGDCTALGHYGVFVEPGVGLGEQLVNMKSLDKFLEEILS